MKRFSRENSYIFSSKCAKTSYISLKKILYKLLYFGEDLVDSLNLCYKEIKMYKHIAKIV